MLVLPSHDDWMNQALLLAERAWEEGEVPVGAVVVGPDHQLLGSGYNQMIQRHDPTAHAEIIALQAAAAHLGNYRLNHCTLYVTLEPCCMCAGALIHARLARLVFATADPKTGAAGSVFHLLSDKRLNHQVETISGCLQAPCASILKRFFKERRSGFLS